MNSLVQHCPQSVTWQMQIKIIFTYDLPRFFSAMHGSTAQCLTSFVGVLPCPFLRYGTFPIPLSYTPFSLPPSIT